MRRKTPHTSDAILGQIIGGGFGKIALRQKAGFDLEIGDILVFEDKDLGHNLIMSVFDLNYSSQIDGKTLEMLSGVSLEEEPADAAFYEPDILNYVIASIKPLAQVRMMQNDNNVTIPKALPPFNGTLRPVSGSDLKFLEKDRGDLFVGHIRSGSEVMKDVEIWMPIEDVFSHHVLIPASTGRGKSNLVKSMLWHVMESKKQVGILVLDAHDEYYGKTTIGLKDHPSARTKLTYYTTERSTTPGARTLSINIKTLEPRHFEGVVEFSETQTNVIHNTFAKRGEDWIAYLMRYNLDDSVHEESGNPDSGSPLDKPPSNNGRDSDKIGKSTIAVIQRKLKMLLGIDITPEGKLYSRYGIFDVDTRGETTANDMVSHIESGKIVVLDASQLASKAELIVGNVIANKLLERYKYCKTTGELSRKPVASIIIEEAPRVIGQDVLASQNDNIYATIAREGRKFKVGLVAITQLSSVIPKTILANMTTKIILGNEMKQEREAIIASAHQDLSDDDKNIASLDKGEAIITSIFVPFATPVKIPLFEDLVKSSAAATRAKPGGIRMFG